MSNEPEKLSQKQGRHWSAESNAAMVRNIEANGWVQSLIHTPSLNFYASAVTEPAVRLIRLDEINDEKHQAYRQALANVYAALDPEQNIRLLYLLSGSPKGVALYFGVIAGDKNTDTHEAMKLLRGALEGQLPGINFGEEINIQDKESIISHWSKWSCQGVMLGVPTPQAEDDTEQDQDFQGVDRLVRALQSGSGKPATLGSGCWQLAVIAQPLERQEIYRQLDAAYHLSSELAALVRTSIQASGNTSRQKSASAGSSNATGVNEGKTDTRGRNEGATDSKSHGTSSSRNSSNSSSGKNKGESQTKTSGTSESRSETTGKSYTQTSTENFSLSDTEGSTLGITQEISDKRAQHLLDFLDKQLIMRLQKGLTNGLFHSAVYLAAENKSTYQRLKNTLRATLQGTEATMSPLIVHDLAGNIRGKFLNLPTVNELPQADGLVFHSMYANIQKGIGSLLTADELAIVASLPQHELQGVRRRKTVDFIVDLADVNENNIIDLGEIIDRGRRYPNNRVSIARADLNKHVFITGVTGAGKTTTCLNLLLESDLPFLVIEPAKTEYRALASKLDLTIDYYRPNGDEHQSLRLNPFALVRKGQRIQSHAGFLKNALTTVFPMEASMPMMVEAAILAAYEEKGWDIDENEYLPGGDPFDPVTRAWPTLSDMIRQLDQIIPTYGLGKEFEEKYRGSLVSRLRSLSDGALGRVLDVPQSIDFSSLLRRRTVIELEELHGGEEKALLMALLLGAINETMRAHNVNDPNFRQLTLIEEAHRLLSRPEPGDKAGALAVESFADMLAEVRKYGTGLIIADQIPAKLIPDVIKNTHTKIVHRLFAEDDRRAMGESMMMDEEQRNFLPNLKVGEAIVFCGGWHGPAHAAIREDLAQTDKPVEFNLHGRSIQQLWRERHRYYPQFCSLGWLSCENDDPACFARFVRETRQAHNQLLNILNADDRRKIHVDGAFKRLQDWLARWQVVAQTDQARHEARRTDAWPVSLLASAWLALLLDANPRPHASDKSGLTLFPITKEDRDNLVEASNALLDLLSRSTTPQAIQDAKRSYPPARDLVTHLNHLTHYKNI